MEIKPIAKIYTDFKEKFGIPRQSCRIKGSYGRIVFEPEYRNVDAIRGIEGFNYLWLIFDFSQSHRDKFSPTVRPPRLGGNVRVGVFASRSPFRPNNLGLSSVKLVEVKLDSELGPILIVEGADVLNETPIYDIKPYLPSDVHSDTLSGYSDQSHKLQVEISDELKNKIPSEKLNAVLSCIEDDPRPSYQNDNTRIYKMKYDNFEIHFIINNCVAKVIDVLI